jgi:hypothetical protein
MLAKVEPVKRASGVNVSLLAKRLTEWDTRVMVNRLPRSQ